jgi:hypothetical protein
LPELELRVAVREGVVAHEAEGQIVPGSIKEAQKPEGDLVPHADFNSIGKDEAVWQIRDLVKTFPCSRCALESVLRPTAAHHAHSRKAQLNPPDTPSRKMSSP